MSAIVPDVGIDARTKEELTPPCECKRGSERKPACDAPATWIAWLIVCTGERTSLYCDSHMQMLVRGDLMCLSCGSPGNRHPLKVLSVEPLR